MISYLKVEAAAFDEIKSDYHREVGLVVGFKKLIL
jgi:hypothetical protein